MSDRPFTERELQVAFTLWVCRQKGMAAVLEDEQLGSAQTLETRGFASRHFKGGQLVWQFTNSGLAALGMTGLLTSHEQRQNETRCWRATARPPPFTPCCLPPAAAARSAASGGR
jgi:hypothetical protein